MEDPPPRVSSKGGIVVGVQVGGGGCKSPPSLELRVEGLLWVERSLRLTFQVGEVVVVDADPVRHSKCE